MKHLLSCCAVALLAAGCGADPAARAAADPAQGSTPSARAVPRGHDWPRFGLDPQRSSSSTAPTGITAANVSSLQRQQVKLDGTIDASAIYLSGVTVKGRKHDTLFVTTTYGKTIAVDADDGSVLWAYTPQDYDSWAGTYRITTATPVADDGRDYIYAASPDGHIQKLSVADGRAAWNTAITKLPEREKIASPLNVFKGRIIAVTGGYIGDAPPYQGHVVVLNPASGQIEHVWNSLCSDQEGLLDPRSSCAESDSAIWGRAGAVVDPSSGNIFVATGNAKWDGEKYWGDSVLELSPDASRVIGNFTPEDTSALNQRDLDLGSTSPVLLGDGYVAQGGKAGHIHLLELSKIRGTNGHRGGETQIVSTPSGDDLFTAPAVRGADLEGGSSSAGPPWMFVADNRGTEAWTLRDGQLQQEWKNSRAGTSPVVAGLLYVYDPNGGLNVYDADSGRRIATLDCGSGHWNSPIVADGRIVLPEGNANDHRTSGVLDIWRLAR
jgi:glucose dehydrogenase